MPINPERIIASRATLPHPVHYQQKMEAEGGCGVIGVAASVPIGGRYLLQSLVQMKNRGNGKGGGIAAVGLDADQLGVTRQILEEDYIVQVAYLDASVRGALEQEFIHSVFLVDHSSPVMAVDFHRVPGLQVEPPFVYRYFCRVRPDMLSRFIAENNLEPLGQQEAADEFVYQNSYRLNAKYYSSLGEKKAFVLSHGKDMIVLKLVGFGDDVIRYYQLEDFKANIWVGHHRYPTKGRVWHPGGAHPFVGMHEALVHNGDFANYHSIQEYLAQRGIRPLFLTDTEVSVLLFDLWSRVYKYPLEFLIEAMAPTTERDFHMLAAEKKSLYGLVQATHIHGSPDGPWFFIVARNASGEGKQLLGITDTSMLRPQVFAIQDGPIKVGLVASERQAINALLRKMAEDGKVPSKFADTYWNARGGSYTDGGAFVFTVKDRESGESTLECKDKFGSEVTIPEGQYHYNPGSKAVGLDLGVSIVQQLHTIERFQSPTALYEYLAPVLKEANYDYLLSVLEELERLAKEDNRRTFSFAMDSLSLLYDRIYDTGTKRRASMLHLIDDSLNRLFASVPGWAAGRPAYVRLDWESRTRLSQSSNETQALVLDAQDFPVDGQDSLARMIVNSYQLGWKRVIAYNLRGHRFIGNGLGPRSNGFRLDCYGDVGDYVGSGIDGAETVVHGAAQDQAGQILKYGRLIVHGDVGQAFMYAAKGGDVYVLGNAAGRPLINAVGRPRVVINGTCLDYLAESFMAGDPSNGGGFVVVNGLKPSWDGRFVEQATPYPGSNLFSLASGGALFIRDPHRRVSSDQLNGGRLAEFSQHDWELILPYLRENERLFGVSVDRDLLSVDGVLMAPNRVYRKVEPVRLTELS